eukprot:COSAG06_NODE_5317_length_3567_cov_2.205882_5_plen_101_part_00
MQWRKKLDVLAYRGEAQEERLEVKNAPRAEPEREYHRQQEVDDEPHVPETVPIDVRATRPHAERHQEAERLIDACRSSTNVFQAFTFPMFVPTLSWQMIV